MSLLARGTVLEGKYEILDRLAGGGMGEVYKVRHIHLHEHRVIKILRSDLADDSDAVARFQREARTATQIKHPSVATLHDYSRLSDGSFYMVWEFIDGQTIAYWIDNHGPFDLRVGLDLGIQALRGLEAIHQADVIHRDMSPDNLMITRDAQGRVRIKIIDLGLAKSLANQGGFESQVGSFQGKLQYCSPEQAGFLKGAPLDHRTDLYSFGLVLYEMLCGLTPYELGKRPGLIMKRLTEDALPLRGRNPKVEIPEDLDQVMRRALARDRDKRFPDAATFITALRAVRRRLEPPPVPTPAVTPSAPARSEPASVPEPGPAPGPASRKEIEERAEATAQALVAAQRALDEGRFQEARRLIAKLDESDPSLLRVEELKRRLGQADSARQQAQVLQTEQMVEEYLSSGQQTLAGMALETLIELEPEHPKKEEYTGRLRKLTGTKEVEKELDGARERLAEGDLKGARAALKGLEKRNAHQFASQLRREIEQAEAEKTRSEALGKIRERIEACLTDGDAGEASAQLEKLADLDVAKVTIDLYRKRIRTLRRRQERETRASDLEQRYAERVANREWRGAREVARQIEEVLGDRSRAAEMLREVSREEERVHREEATAQGWEALDRYLGEGKLAEAEIAHRVLRQMAPDHPKHKKVERRLRALRKKRGARDRRAVSR